WRGVHIAIGELVALLLSGRQAGIEYVGVPALYQRHLSAARDHSNGRGQDRLLPVPDLDRNYPDPGRRLNDDAQAGVSGQEAGLNATIICWGPVGASRPGLEICESYDEFPRWRDRIQRPLPVAQRPRRQAGWRAGYCAQGTPLHWRHVQRRLLSCRGARPASAEIGYVRPCAKEHAVASPADP